MPTAHPDLIIVFPPSTRAGAPRLPSAGVSFSIGRLRPSISRRRAVVSPAPTDASVASPGVRWRR
ncbi:hypothetical protein U9M48_036772 [Paspalum notatum var. saurae]|uniref:Uncharacterized protein n=1 Tax=Paspalum notatum var. saurae TaxID=547442 RepID=A0AAQ3UHX2_PASNO